MLLSLCKQVQVKYDVCYVAHVGKFGGSLRLCTMLFTKRIHARVKSLRIIEQCFPFYSTGGRILSVCVACSYWLMDDVRLELGDCHWCGGYAKASCSVWLRHPVLPFLVADEYIKAVEHFADQLEAQKM